MGYFNSKKKETKRIDTKLMADINAHPQWGYTKLPLMKITIKDEMFGQQT